MPDKKILDDKTIEIKQDSSKLTIYQKLALIQQEGLGLIKQNQARTAKKNYKYYKKEELKSLIIPLLKKYNLGYTFNQHPEIFNANNDFYINYLEFILFNADSPDQFINFKDYIPVEYKPKYMALGQYRGSSDTHLWKYILANIFNVLTSETDLDDLTKNNQSLTKINENKQKDIDELEYLKYLSTLIPTPELKVLRQNALKNKFNQEQQLNLMIEFLDMQDIKYKKISEFKNVPN